MKRLNGLLLLFITYSTLIGCELDNVGPLAVKNGMAVGTVIGKEQCNADTLKDYWLIEIHSAPTVRQQYGDTVMIDGISYVNLIKTTGLTEDLKKPGQKIGIEFNIADKSTLTTNCTVSDPIVYQLKDAEIIMCGPAAF